MVIGSVWTGEIDKALYDLLPSIVSVKGIPIVAYPRFPDSDFVEEHYPCITFFNYNQMIAEQKSRHERYVWLEDTSDGKMVLQKEPEKWYLFYQIDFWAKKQGDMNEMTKLWNVAVGKHYILELTDDAGNSVVTKMILQHFVNLDSSEVESREFRRSYSYRITGELMEEPPKTFGKVTDVRVTKLDIRRRNIG